LFGGLGAKSETGSSSPSSTSSGGGGGGLFAGLSPTPAFGGFGASSAASPSPAFSSAGIGGATSGLAFGSGPGTTVPGMFSPKKGEKYQKKEDRRQGGGSGF
jgi:hypothetical protein